TKHVIHKNKANRIKSRLAKRINKNKQEVKLG
ncbi:30S ribosomal protein S20, partial [bacterium]|nr:30S ribosomal protein S20 [bacterium]